LRQSPAENNNSLSPKLRSPTVAIIKVVSTTRRRGLRHSNRIMRMFPWLNLNKKRTPSIKLRLRAMRKKRRHRINLEDSNKSSK